MVISHSVTGKPHHRNYGCKERIKAEEANKVFEKGLKTINVHEEAIDLFMKVIEDAGKVSVTDRQKTIVEAQQDIDRNKARLKEAQRMRLDQEMDAHLPRYVPHCADLLKNLPQYYSDASLQGKQLIIGSIFPEKLIFENENYRTTKVDEIFERIYSAGAGSGENENGTFQFNTEKSHLCTRERS